MYIKKSRIRNIDVGKMSKKEAEEYIKNTMRRYNLKNKCINICDIII
jgi:hypothetical protein